MKLIAGLGNPGAKYRQTRHNVGYRVIAELHNRFGKPRPSSRFDSELVQVMVAESGQKILLQSPLTFMNASGRAVRAAADFYKIPVEDILIVCDDFNLDLGRLRFRPGGSAGGQNGLSDVIQRFGTQDIARLRIGVGKPPPGWDAAKYVLGKFRSEEELDVDRSIQRAADGVLTWIERGTQESMNRFNADPNKPKRPEKAREKPGEPDSSRTARQESLPRKRRIDDNGDRDTNQL